MNLGKLVWRNLPRRKGRFVFTLAGVGSFSHFFGAFGGGTY